MKTTDESLSRFLGRYPELKLVIMFGSQASGSASFNSDIDLGVLADTPLSSKFKLQLIEEIGAQFGSPMDIVDLYYAPEPVLGQVFKGRRILGDNVTFASLLSKHLLNTADFVPLQQRILSERRQAWIR